VVSNRGRRWILTAVRSAFIIVGSSPMLASTFDVDLDESAKARAHQVAYVDWATVGSPANKLLLIRHDRERCAIRFSFFCRDPNSQLKSVYDSGEDTFTGEYDWYHWSGVDRPPSTTLESGHRKVTRGTLVGIGRLAFATGDVLVRCGPFELQWYYPRQVSFFGRGSLKNTGAELAPTAWRDIRDVDFNDRRLTWYAPDENRVKTEIPIGDLVGAGK
jgi:hypothetical protein